MVARGQVKLTTKGLFSFGDLMPGAQASGAQVEPFWLAINRNSGRVNIRQPEAVGVALGVADVMTELRCFTA